MQIGDNFSVGLAEASHEKMGPLCLSRPSLVTSRNVAFHSNEVSVTD